MIKIGIYYDYYYYYLNNINNKITKHHDDVLQVFMDAEYTDGRKLTDQEVGGLMVALLFAGQHTSSITSSWTGYYILQQKNKFLFVLFINIINN